MHAILFQMALIPFTMSRFSIAALSGSIVDRFVPLNRTLQMHIHLGYTMVTIVFVATIFFFGFFGMLCNDGEQAFCDKFTSEIMCTGYGILASLLIVAFSSYFRYKIPYEIFYIIHHLVFAMYIITIAHTIDVVERKGLRDRSQTFKWFSAPLLYYACDRAIMYINHRYTTPVKTSVAVESANGSRMIILKLKRPTLFEFQPGQYAFLRVSDIDINWHRKYPFLSLFESSSILGLSGSLFLQRSRLHPTPPLLTWNFTSRYLTRSLGPASSTIG